MTTRMRVAKIPKEELEKRCAEGTMYADFVPIGKWIVDEADLNLYGRGTRIWKCHCPECGKDPQKEYISGTEDWWLNKLPNFCPSCGADLREQAFTESVLDEIATELEELEKTEPFAYGDTKIRMGVGLGIMKARKIVDNYREEGETK